MAGTVAGGGVRAVANPADVARVEANLARFNLNVNSGARSVGVAWARALEAGLDRAATHARAPQTRRFRGAAKASEESTGAVVVIDAAGAGFYNNSAVLSATEHGSNLTAFHAPRGGHYWIAPTVTASEGVAVGAAREMTTANVARCNRGG